MSAAPVALRRRGGARLVPLDGPEIALPYKRVSSEEQAKKGISLDVQKAAISRYIKQQDGWILGGEFSDHQTGKRTDRDGYQNMLGQVRSLAVSGNRVRVVILRVDRLGRDIEELQRARKELESLGAEIHSVRDGGVPDPLMYDFASVLAAQEVRILSNRVCDSLDKFVEHGWRPPGRPAWGYTWRERTDVEKQMSAPKSVMVPAKDERPYVEEAWQRRASGESLQSISRWAATLSEQARGGRNLPFPAIMQMFKAPVYIGRFGGYDAADDPQLLEQPRGRWEPLVDDALWERAQEQRVRARRMPRQATERYLLTGLIRCPRCSGRMAGRTNRTKWRAKKRVEVREYASREYHCCAWSEGARTGSAARCYAVVPAKTVEAFVERVVTEMLAMADRPRSRDEIADEHERRKRRSSGDTTEQEIAAREREIRETHRRRSDATARLLDGTITKEEHDNFQAHALATVRAAEEKVAQLRGRKRQRGIDLPLEAVLSQVGGWADLFPNATIDKQRLMLGGLFEQIVPVRTGYGKYIAWMPTTALGDGVMRLALARGGSEFLVGVEKFGQTNYLTPTE